MQATRDPNRPLRGALRANALFSVATGLPMLVLPVPVSAFLGFDRPWVIAVLGAIVILNAALLWRASGRRPFRLIDAGLAIGGDVGWVAATLAVYLIAPDTFSTRGWWMATAVAEFVGLFALLQFTGLRRLQLAAQGARGAVHHPTADDRRRG